MFASIIAALIAIARAIPLLAGLVRSAAEAWIEHEKADNEAEAQRRRADKDAAVDAGIDKWVSVARSAAKQPTTDGAAGLPAGGVSGPGVGSGQPQDNQRAGIGIGT